MIQKFRLPAFLVIPSLLLAVPGVRAQDAADEDPSPIPLARENSDIEPDPDVAWGVLENGLRYAILPNEEPPGRISMRLFVDAGSLMEADDQRGLAHFLEHMAFNGTENFPPGEMVEYFQRLGMGFGSHTNAHTGFRETVYKLELPNAKEKMIDEGMMLLRDYADRMSLLPDQIESERGVILSEKRARDSVGWRTFVEQMKFAFPEHRLSRRMPIGTEKVIENAPRERFVRFYENWYTPNRMAVVVVGEVEPPQIESLVEKHFGSMPARQKRPTPPMGELAGRDYAAHYHHEPEAGETSLSIEALQSRVDPPDDRERRAHDLRLSLAERIIDRRLERIAKQKDAPVSSASMSTGDFFDLGFALYGSIEADCKPGEWDEALALIEQELRRALEHGFTSAEMKETKAVVEQLHEEAARQMDTRKSRQLADTIAGHIGSRRIFTSPADDLSRVREMLEATTAGDCRETLAKLWNGAEDTLVFVSGNVEIEGAGDTITAAFEESREVAVKPSEEKSVGTFAYADLPEPGSVAEREGHEDIGVTQLRFENGLRANVKRTDFEDDTVRVKARIGPGRITEPAPGLSFFLSSTFTKGGLEKHSQDDLKQLFAGKSVGVSFSVEDDAFALSGETSPADLADQLGLMRAYVMDPGFRDEAATEFRGGLDHIYQQLEHTPGGFTQDVVDRFLHGGDDRFGYPEQEKLEALTLERARQWVMPHLASGYCEITVVGDIDPQAAIDALARTFGNLPERDTEKPPYPEKRQVGFPQAESRRFAFESQIPKGRAAIHWPTTDIYEIGTTRRLSVLAAILDDRLRVKLREELGDAYSPFSHNLPSDTWTDYGYLFATVTVDPEQAKEVTGVISDIAAELSTGESITADELARARKPIITSIEEMRRTNRYWMGSVLEASQEYPQRLEWSRSFVSDYESITVEEVNELAAKYLTEEAGVSVVVAPKGDTPTKPSEAEQASDETDSSGETESSEDGESSERGESSNQSTGDDAEDQSSE